MNKILKLITFILALVIIGEIIYFGKNFNTSEKVPSEKLDRLEYVAKNVNKYKNNDLVNAYLVIEMKGYIKENVYFYRNNVNEYLITFYDDKTKQEQKMSFMDFKDYKVESTKVILTEGEKKSNISIKEIKPGDYFVYTLEESLEDGTIIDRFIEITRDNE